jgi:hypothetical protein
MIYSILGLHMFKGLNENRCRLSSTPPSEPGALWEVAPDTPFYCGAKNCPEGYHYCLIYKNFTYLFSYKNSIKDFLYQSK